MYTDDDCTILYKGDEYCFYGADLDVRLEGDTIEEVLLQFKEITVKDGGKATEFTREWMQGLATAIEHGLADEYGEVQGNQEFTFNFYKNS
jgi:hypothetical protein